MKKQMYPITVQVSASQDETVIMLIQENLVNEGDMVQVAPDQIDTLIQWLKEAKAKALGIGSDDNADELRIGALQAVEDGLGGLLKAGNLPADVKPHIQTYYDIAKAARPE